MSRYREELGRFARRPEELDDAVYTLSNPPTSPTSLTIHNPIAMAENEEVQHRSLRDYLHPTRTATPSCIMFPPNMQNLDFKPGMVQLLPTFHGLERENPYVHIREFEEVVATFTAKLTLRVPSSWNSFLFLSRIRLKNGCILYDQGRLERGKRWRRNFLRSISHTIKPTVWSGRSLPSPKRTMKLFIKYGRGLRIC